MKFHLKPISGWILAALLAAAPLSAIGADPASKPADNSAKAAQATRSTTAQNSSARKPLDLKAPPLDRVFTRNQIETITSSPDDVSENAETVAVEGARHDRIVAPNGLRGLAWGVRHPTQAWRLFVPSPSE